MIPEGGNVMWSRTQGYSIINSSCINVYLSGIVLIGFYIQCTCLNALEVLLDKLAATVVAGVPERSK